MDVAAWLKENKLDAYDFEEQGYDDVEDILALNTEEVNKLADSLNMKPGHHKKLLRLTGNATGTGTDATVVSETTSLEPGKLLKGRFKLEKKLGSGSMGTVWLANDRKLYRRVALKMAHGGESRMDNMKIEARLQQEAKAFGQCQHKNILSVFDCDFAHKPSFIACEHLGDTSLDTLINDKSGRLTPHNITSLAVDIMQALAHVHSKGWVRHSRIYFHSIVITNAYYWFPLFSGPPRCQAIQHHDPI
jgi:hypothetical protein